MAIPVGAFLAATMNHNHNEICDELDKKYLENMNKIKENSQLILKYLKDTFKAEEVVIGRYELDSIIYELYFYDINIGIRINTNDMINTDIKYLQSYAYHLVYGELIKNMERKHINNLESKGE